MVSMVDRRRLRLEIEAEASVPAEATMAIVASDGRVKPAVGGLLFPNGTVITPDSQCLIVAETCRARLTAFDIQPDGSLSNRRVFADLSPNISFKLSNPDW